MARFAVAVRIGPALVALLLVACSGGAEDSASEPPVRPTWWQDVRPIVFDSCTGCHRADAAGIPTYETYEQVAPNAAYMLDKMVGSEDAPYIMPPYPAPDADGCSPVGAYKDDPRLSAEQIDVFRRWVARGTPEGDRASATPVDVPEELRLNGDVVTSLPQDPGGVDHVIPGDPDSLDYTRCFSFSIEDAPFDENGLAYIRGMKIVGGASSASIHHIIVASDPDGVTAANADAGAGGYKYSCTENEIPDSDLLMTYVHNTPLFYFPEDSAYTIPRGARILFTVHYHQAPTDQYDDTSMQIEWAAERPTYHAWMDRFGGASTNQADFVYLDAPQRGGWIEPPFLIPAGETDWNERWKQRWSGETYPIWGVFPHMHYAGASIRMWVERPDGSTQCLSDIDRFDFNWQLTYLYDAPVDGLPVLARDDDMVIDCHYNNSESNDRLWAAMYAEDWLYPVDLGVGEDGFNEMCVMHFGTLVENDRRFPPSPADGPTPLRQ
jgi:hypothetical protein